MKPDKNHSNGLSSLHLIFHRQQLTRQWLSLRQPQHNHRLMVLTIKGYVEAITRT